MIRSLFSAVSGLTSMQEAIDVIGNNIANVNTVGFKASSAEFSEAFSQTERIADQTDPIGLDVGLGTRVVGTVTDFGQGAFQTTSIPSNVAISGNGFFVIDTTIDPTTGAGTGNTLYSRAGDFTVDAQGYLRTADGYYVMGYSAGTTPAAATADNALYGGSGLETTGFGFAATAGTTTVFSDFSASAGTAISTGSLTAIQIPTTIDEVSYSAGTGYSAGTASSVANYSIGSTGSITVVGEDGTNVVIGYLPIATFASVAGLNSQGAGYYTPTQASGATSINTPGIGNSGVLQGGALELSNANIANEFSEMIIVQNGYTANAKVITVSNQMLQVADGLIQ